jgi:hypothetical protein
MRAFSKSKKREESKRREESRNKVLTKLRTGHSPIGHLGFSSNIHMFSSKQHSVSPMTARAHPKFRSDL